MSFNRGTIAAATVIIVIGFAIGALLAVLGRGSGDRPQPLPIARTTGPAAPAPAHTAGPTPQAAVAAPPGSWQVDEANVRVGTIVWAGEAVMSSGNTMVLDTYKQSVAGRSATKCERQTRL